MNNRYLNKSVVAIVAATTLFSGSALAVTIGVPAGSDAIPTGNYVFNGDVKLVAPGGSPSATCSLTLTGNVTNETSPAGVYIDVVSGSVSTAQNHPFDLKCFGITPNGFTASKTGTNAHPGSWEAFIPEKSEEGVRSCIATFSRMQA